MVGLLCDIIAKIYEFGGYMINKKTWDEFRNTGLVLYINQILHVFGWAIVFEKKEDGAFEVYPARVKFRGFDSKSVTESYIKISEYMDENSEELLKESKE